MEDVRLEAVLLLYLLSGPEAEDMDRLVESIRAALDAEQLVGPWITLRDDAA